MPDNVFCFEQPLNERIRTLLRLEHLITRLRYHEADDSLWGRRAAVTALLDILNVMSRYDTRAEVSKELGQCYAGLERLADRDDVDARALARILEELDTRGRNLQRMPPQFASYQLRDDALLNALNNRLPIPGGDCSFDVPSYQHWLSQNAATIEADLAAWSQRIVIFEQAITTLLRLLRDSTTPSEATAQAGVLVHNTEAGTQMIRIFLDDAICYPEISAGRHRATIRFMAYDARPNVVQAREPVHFRMACCGFPGA